MHRSVFLLKGYRIVFSYHQVQEHPKLFLAMTGLTQAEFDQLLPHFQCAWEQYVQQNDVDRDDRQRQYGGGRSELTLVSNSHFGLARGSRLPSTPSPAKVAIP